MKLDEKDRAIIKELVKDSKQTTSQLGKKLNMPITTVHNRIKKLVKNEIILNYTVNLNYKKLERPIPAYIGVSVEYRIGKKKLKQREIAQKIKDVDGVEEVYIMTGGSDILIKLLAKDIDSLNEIVTEKLREIDGVDKTQTAIVLTEIK